MADFPKNRHDLEAMLNAKAWKDPKFKKKLLENPKAAMKEMGFETSKEVKIRVVEDDKNTVTFVIQAEPSNLAMRDEDELKKIAGGSKDDTATRICLGTKVCPIC